MSVMTNCDILTPISVKRLDAHLWRFTKDDDNKWKYLRKECNSDLNTPYHYGVTPHHIHIFSSRRVER